MMRISGLLVQEYRFERATLEQAYAVADCCAHDAFAG